MAVVEAIATQYLEANASSVTFSTIPQTYEHLELRVSTHDTYDTTYDQIYIRFNGDTGSNYWYHYAEGYGSSENTSYGGATTAGRCSQSIGSWDGSDPGIPTSYYSSGIVTILDYANANKNTTVNGLSGLSYDTPSASARNSVWMGSSVWDNTAAITSITLLTTLGSGVFARGSVFNLYGWNSS
jgi:hypothetical protein